MLAHATEKLNIEWLNEPHESQSSKFDDCFISGPNCHPTQRKLQFLSDLHHKISRSWNHIFSACFTNITNADITNLVGSVDHGYAAILLIKDMLVSHFLLSSAPSLKSHPLLPT